MINRFAALACMFLAPAVLAQEEKPKQFEITKQVQQRLDEWKKTLAEWAADKVVVAAVVAQNEKGPIAGMDNKKWKALRRRSAEVDAFIDNAAAKQIGKLAKETDGVVTEAFVNACKGEKVAFLEKTSSYLHVGSPKFDVPFTKGETWQGSAAFDESSQTYAIQVSVPVLDPKDQKKVIGVLVVGLSLDQIANPKPPAPVK